MAKKKESLTLKFDALLISRMFVGKKIGHFPKPTVETCLIIDAKRLMESVQWQWIWTADLNWRETASDQLLTAHIQWVLGTLVLAYILADHPYISTALSHENLVLDPTFELVALEKHT
uniref:Uncharacterized protein n=1 Tax=Cucumis melo TaxID=3656 RepID=A0A9I9EAB8_CUCME